MAPISIGVTAYRDTGCRGHWACDGNRPGRSGEECQVGRKRKRALATPSLLTELDWKRSSQGIHFGRAPPLLFAENHNNSASNPDARDGLRKHARMTWLRRIFPKKTMRGCHSRGGRGTETLRAVAPVPGPFVIIRRSRAKNLAQRSVCLNKHVSDPCSLYQWYPRIVFFSESRKSYVPYCFTNSTRRFFAFPSSVSFEATGQ